jgi:hypothetical protein
MVLLHLLQFAANLIKRGWDAVARRGNPDTEEYELRSFFKHL